MKYNKTIRLVLVPAILLILFFGSAACHARAAKSDKNAGKGHPAPHKPTAPISISFSAPERIKIDENAVVVVNIKTLSSASGLKIKITADAGLEMKTGMHGVYEVEYAGAPKDRTFTETVVVVARSEGILYLNVFATGTFGNRQMGHVASIPLRVGSNPLKLMKKSGQPSTDEKGQNIIILPAEEK